MKFFKKLYRFLELVILLDFGALGINHIFIQFSNKINNLACYVLIHDTCFKK